MEQNNFEQQVSTPMPPKPDNNLVLAIICTICCCLPLGIVGIVKASKVNGLYYAEQKTGKNVFEVKDKKVRVVKENSPKNICSKEGYISDSTKPLICLPNKVVIKIVQSSDMDGVVY